jgi:hypothetical protein
MRRQRGRDYDCGVDDERASAPPGERRLDRPPSDRYATPAEASTDASTTLLTSAQSVPIAGLFAVLGGLAITFGGGLLAITAGLVIVAVAIGWGVATVLTLGPARRSARATWVSIAMACGGVALGQLGLWLVARQEGGVLGVVDYLAETFGYLVPLQFLGAAGAAWWRSR